MKLTAIKLLTLFVFSSTLFSCDSGENTLVIERSNEDFAPNTAGSSWTYFYPSLEEFTYTIVISNKAKKINGQTYYETVSSGQHAYMRKEGNAYIQYELFDGMYVDNEFTYLKDEAVGTKWTEYMYPDTENENILELEVIETGETYSVGDNTFINVIAVKITNVTEETEDPFYTINYYAKGVGHLKSEDYEGNSIIELVSYTIK